MEIITLQEYTDQYVSLYEGEIRNLPNDLALRLINKGVAAQHDGDILNSTTPQDNGKVLTVVNGKPAFSAPATVNSEFVPNYKIIYAKVMQYGEYVMPKSGEELVFDTNGHDPISIIFKDSQFSQYFTAQEIYNLYNNSDFLIAKIEMPKSNQIRTYDLVGKVEYFAPGEGYTSDGVSLIYDTTNNLLAYTYSQDFGVLEIEK